MEKIFKNGKMHKGKTDNLPKKIQLKFGIFILSNNYVKLIFLNQQ